MEKITKSESRAKAPEDVRRITQEIANKSEDMLMLDTFSPDHLPASKEKESTVSDLPCKEQAIIFTPCTEKESQGD